MTDQPPSNNLPALYKESIRKEVATAFSKWIVASIVGLLTISALGWWLYLKENVLPYLGGVPKGAIVLFERQCPENKDIWLDVSENNRSFEGLYIRVKGNLSPLGGNDSDVLTNDNIPRLTVDTSTYNRNDKVLWGFSANDGSIKNYSFVKRDDGYGGTAPYPVSTFFVGNPNPTAIKIEPKYMTLTLCQKR